MQKAIILRNDEVQAILRGHKTTIRLPAFAQEDLREFHVKLYPEGWWFRGRCYQNWQAAEHDILSVQRLSRYSRGDTLYVKEAWVPDPGGNGIFYKADMPIRNSTTCLRSSDLKWKSGACMPKDSARLFLRVQSIHIERLQDISAEQCEAEGIRAWTKDGRLYKYYPADEEGDYPDCKWSECPRTPQEAMHTWWDIRYKNQLRAKGWDANPWVLVVKFTPFLKDMLE